MALRHLRRVFVEDASAVGEARRAGAECARACGFDETVAARVQIAVTELATNLIRHAGGGEIQLRRVECAGVAGIETLSIDRGPGMTDPARCMRDGYSTAGGGGTGLGAVDRASDLFDLFTEPGRGSLILSRVWAGRLPSELPARPMAVGVVSLSMTEGEECGDGFAAEQSARRSVFLVVDGLGHGPGAALAAREAERAFRGECARSPAGIAEAIHAALRPTRGAAIAVLEIDHREGVSRFCGIGNISARLVSESGVRSLVSHNGVAGHEARCFREYSHPWDFSMRAVMHSDGISSRWSLSGRAGLLARHPAICAALLARDHARGRDDLTALVTCAAWRSAHRGGVEG